MVGDCRELMAGLADGSVDAIVTDPPYELGFMGKSWDASGIAYDLDVWRQALRVLKPGGHLLAFSGSRTYHRMVCAIEDAGFEIRDQIMWLNGNGFPKSHNVSKAIDASIMYGKSNSAGMRMFNDNHAISSRRLNGVDSRLRQRGIEQGYRTEKTIKREHAPITAPATPEAERWSGWGTALKPAHEPIVVARKPFKGTVARNVLAHGTGALNIDGCRVEASDGSNRSRDNSKCEQDEFFSGKKRINQVIPDGLGRWPANVIHDGSDEITSGLGETSRFFYCAKASKRDREEGLQPGDRRANHHPTVKPTDLMRYLCRLVTPPGGIVLDPFTGSGSTGKAAVLEGFRFLGCELSEEYAAIARVRIAAAQGPGARSQGPDTP